jgi:hypothetical protein
MSVSTAERGAKWVTRKKGERFYKDCMQNNFWSGRATFMVWGAIGYNWKSKLIFLKGTGKRGVCGRDYLEQVLEPYLGPLFQNEESELYNPEDYFPGLDAGGTYVEDNAGVHGTKKLLVKEKGKLKIICHNHPPSIPDVNPIEYIWRLIKGRIRQRKTFPKCLKEHKKAVQEEWGQGLF